MKKILFYTLIVTLLLTGCQKKNKTNYEKLMIEENTVIQSIEKEFGDAEESTIIDDAYVYNDFELFDGYFGTLFITTDNTVITKWAWTLNGYNEERASEIIKKVTNKFNKNDIVELPEEIAADHKEICLKLDTSMIYIYEYPTSDNPSVSIHYDINPPYTFDEIKEHMDRLQSK